MQQVKCVLVGGRESRRSRKLSQPCSKPRFMFVPWQREAAMNKDEWKAFFGWLDSASEAQLVEMERARCLSAELTRLLLSRE